MSNDKKTDGELGEGELSELLKDLPRIIKLLLVDSASDQSNVEEVDDVKKRKMMNKEEKQ